MDETSLVHRIAAEFSECTRKRVQVCNVFSPGALLAGLFSAMGKTRFIQFDLQSTDPFLKPFLDYFVSGGLPSRETAFEAGWRSHLTEIALLQGAEGMQTAAGLQPLREKLKRYLLFGVDGSEVIPGVVSSFTETLPTVFCLLNYRNGTLFDQPGENVPGLIAFTGEGQGLPFPDLVLDSGLVSLSRVERYLGEQNCRVPASRVLKASAGRAGLVELFAGISRVFKIQSDDTLEMLHTVLDENAELARLALAAAVLSPGFVRDEALALSAVQSEQVFHTGSEINLWQGGRIAEFISQEARKAVLDRLDTLELARLYVHAAEIVLELRGNSSISLGFAGELMLRAGAGERASTLFHRAAELDNRELKKAEFYRKAALFSSADRQELLFRADLGLFRERLSAAPEFIPETLKRDDFPELSPVLADSERFFCSGRYHRAYDLLAGFAIKGKMHLPVALVEIGCQFFRRNMFDASMNVVKSAAFHAADAGSGWLESKALETYVKSCNRTGRFAEAGKASGRLVELALNSGNRRKLVTVYNLIANTLILQTRYESALRVFTSSLRTLSEDQDDLRSQILNNMSIAQRKLYRTDEALGSLMRFVRSAISMGSLDKASTAYGNMARLFIDLSRFDSAMDCLESMIEFRRISGGAIADDSILFISSQIAFARGQTDEALSLISEAVMQARTLGSLRRLSLNLVKKGSMLLTLGEYAEASAVLQEAEDASLQSSSMLNTFVARVKGTAARCFTGKSQPWEILAIPLSGNPEETNRGEQFYYHWKLTASRQSLYAAACLLSKGLAKGLHYHSYISMLDDVTCELPSSLADTLPLVHNYLSCNQAKGE